MRNNLFLQKYSFRMWIIIAHLFCFLLIFVWMTRVSIIVLFFFEEFCVSGAILQGYIIKFLKDFFLLLKYSNHANNNFFWRIFFLLFTVKSLKLHVIKKSIKTNIYVWITLIDWKRFFLDRKNTQKILLCLSTFGQTQVVEKQYNDTWFSFLLFFFPYWQIQITENTMIE